MADISQQYEGFEFLEPLIADMVQDDPAARPTMEEVVARFDDIQAKLKYWKLRERLVRKGESPLIKFLKNVRHVYRTTKFILSFRSPVPTPRYIPPPS